MSKLLDICPALDALFLYWSHPNWCDSAVSWEETSAAISRGGHNLQRLELLSQVNYKPEGSYLGSMQDASNLLDLTATSSILFGLQYEHETIYNEVSRLTLILPFSLQVLEVVQGDESDDAWHDQVLWTLMTDARFAAPGLIIVHRSRAFS
ncbi:hypothetical protein LTR95_009487, partial [Oleoguttula sp. CCFEE 5521]